MALVVRNKHIQFDMVRLDL